MIYITNSPKKKRIHIKRRIKEIEKKYVYLVHKTIKNTRKNNNKHMNIDTSTSEIFKGFIGKKRETRQKYFGIKKIDEKWANKKILHCLKCSWKFTDKISEKERNIEVCKCFDDRGNLDIFECNEEQKIKIFKNCTNEQMIEMINCPICGKNIGNDFLKEKQIHLYECSKKNII